MKKTKDQDSNSLNTFIFSSIHCRILLGQNFLFLQLSANEQLHAIKIKVNITRTSTLTYG
ncbi:hypothetical protein DERP_002107 [Dermatophagoides pteronyssinus]|uniref:Uncharacterized protein n=1 Tax=Dermatophagoides pteronyssinus TaxID=6956 RepID=A0ABQ8JHB4_DERPT|nr:hypothetical protein DERP_002107 [Dermatophagoides pteronyssinus]